MPTFDKLTMFADATALSTAAPATAKFGNAFNLNKTGLDVGEGHPLSWWLSVNNAVTSGGSATVSIQLVTADNEALTTNPEVVLDTGAIAVATLAAGYIYPHLHLPRRTYRLWLGLRQVIATAALTGGTMTSGLLLNAPNWRSYPDAVN